MDATTTTTQAGAHRLAPLTRESCVKAAAYEYQGTYVLPTDNNTQPVRVHGHHHASPASSHHWHSPMMSRRYSGLTPPLPRERVSQLDAKFRILSPSVHRHEATRGNYLFSPSCRLVTSAAREFAPQSQPDGPPSPSLAFPFRFPMEKTMCLAPPLPSSHSVCRVPLAPSSPPLPSPLIPALHPRTTPTPFGDISRRTRSYSV